jgi:hypothetical protein
VKSLPQDLVAALMKRRGTLSIDWARTPGVIEAAEAHGILPLMADMGGIVGLRQDGALLELAWDSSEPRPVTSRRWADLALLRAAQRYPELSSVLPRRTVGAAECTQCQGTGTPAAIASSLAGATCVCGGLGWIPEEWLLERL